MLIIVGFAASNLVSLANMRDVEANSRLLVEDTLTSSELVSRMTRDIDQKRLLVDEHLIERSPEAMANLDRRLAQIDANFAAAARAYEPVATLPEERTAWESLKEQVAAIQAPIAQALDRSRRNEDGEARAMIVRLQGRFDAIGRAEDALVGIDHAQAESVTAAIASQQRRARYLLTALTAGGAALALFLAGWVTRIFARQDVQVRNTLLLLEQRNRELDAFAGRVAHDLRGPLTTISLSAATLSEQLPGGAGTFAVLERGVSRMEGLIQDLLALSRVQGPTPGTIAKIATVVSAAEQDLRPEVETVGGLLHIDVEPAEVRCSDGLLRQVLWNLGENAVKYRRTDVQLELRIDGRIKGGRYELRVSDNGPGMSSHVASQAFEPLFRGEPARSIPGTGLGLAIVKRIIEASGGAVSIDSQIGRGTTFVIDLPLGGKDVASRDELLPVLHEPT